MSLNSGFLIKLIDDFTICLKKTCPSVIICSNSAATIQNGITCGSGTNFPFPTNHVQPNGRKAFIEVSVFALWLELSLSHKNILKGITAKFYNININGNIQGKVEFKFVI